MIPSGVQVFVALEPIDMRYSFDRLGAAKEQVGYDARGGALFVFYGRRRDALKVLFFDGTGMCIFYKRLDRGTFKLPEQRHRPALDGSEDQLRGRRPLGRRPYISTPPTGKRPTIEPRSPAHGMIKTPRFWMIGSTPPDARSVFRAWLRSPQGAFRGLAYGLCRALQADAEGQRLTTFDDRRANQARRGLACVAEEPAGVAEDAVRVARADRQIENAAGRGANGRHACRVDEVEPDVRRAGAAHQWARRAGRRTIGISEAGERGRHHHACGAGVVSVDGAHPRVADLETVGSCARRRAQLSGACGRVPREAATVAALRPKAVDLRRGLFRRWRRTEGRAGQRQAERDHNDRTHE